MSASQPAMATPSLWTTAACCGPVCWPRRWRFPQSIQNHGVTQGTHGSLCYASNGSFVPGFVSPRPLVFNEIGSFVPPKKFWRLLRFRQFRVYCRCFTSSNLFEVKRLYSKVDNPASQTLLFPDRNPLWLPESSGYPDILNASLARLRLSFCG